MCKVQSISPFPVIWIRHIRSQWDPSVPFDSGSLCHTCKFSAPTDWSFTQLHNPSFSHLTWLTSGLLSINWTSTYIHWVQLPIQHLEEPITLRILWQLSTSLGYGKPVYGNIPEAEPTVGFSGPAKAVRLLSYWQLGVHGTPGLAVLWVCVYGLKVRQSRVLYSYITNHWSGTQLHNP